MIETALIDPVLFVRWRERCEASDIAYIKRDTEAAHRRLGERLVYVAIIPVGVPPPDAETRAALRNGTTHAAELCRSIHIVIDGEGLRRALIRSVTAGLLLASRRSFRIHADVEDALQEAAKIVDFDPAACYERARTLGLLGEGT